MHVCARARMQRLVLCAAYTWERWCLSEKVDA